MSDPISEQSAPPFDGVGLSQFRVRVAVPSPQVTLHDQADHVEYPPSTARNKRHYQTSPIGSQKLSIITDALMA